MKDFGVDLSKLSHPKEEKFPIRETVPGRVVHIDADFLAYQVSYDDEKSISEMRGNCDTVVEKMRLMAGAESVQLHLTPKDSDKGDRYNLALLKEYQANRKDKPKPKFLHVIREWMHKERGALLHMDCEADDGMSMAQYKAIAEGTPELSVIATKDKDLCMVPGLQLNWDTGEITDTKDDPFGFIRLHVMDNKQKTKKVVGRGWKFFWAQVLMGDPADNISGLPMCYLPEYLSASGKPKKVGPVLAYEILENVKTNKEAFEIVRELYKVCDENEPFVNWRDGSPIGFGQAFLSEASLLWMRRVNSPTDVLDWIKEEIYEDR